SSSTKMTGDTTIYAHWIQDAFTVSWNTGTGYTIRVNRTKSSRGSTGQISSGSIVYKGDVLAEENSEVILIGKEDLLFLLSENSDFLKEYLKIQSDAGKNLHFRIRLLSIESARERFFYYMHEHSNTIRISSVSALARQLFLSRETLSRLLSTLTKEKRIIKEGNVIRLL
ncbi:MAG: Crp/Fnr family transcriptional regulator, partial [Erysipelotrichaceae bacterium]|nr:Crp/Fnr family transcriptional regulator [Erysipelotrichaceae bacterium]